MNRKLVLIETKEHFFRFHIQFQNRTYFLKKWKESGEIEIAIHEIGSNIIEVIDRETQRFDDIKWMFINAILDEKGDDKHE